MVNTKTGAMQRVAPDEESNSGFVAVTPDGMRVFDADIDGVRAFYVASGNQVALIPAGAVNFAFGTKTNTLYANDVNQISAINPTTNTIMHFNLQPIGNPKADCLFSARRRQRIVWVPAEVRSERQPAITEDLEDGSSRENHVTRTQGAAV